MINKRILLIYTGGTIGMIKDKGPSGKTCIDLDGPRGNAFSLMASAKSLAKVMGLDENKVLEEMQAGDYVDLLITFENIFGAVVDLETSSDSLMDSIFERRDELEQLIPLKTVQAVLAARDT